MTALRWLCGLFRHSFDVVVNVADHDGRVETHTCRRCGHAIQVVYDIAGERLTRPTDGQGER
jgi:hypothetical protein